MHNNLFEINSLAALKEDKATLIRELESIYMSVIINHKKKFLKITNDADNYNDGIKKLEINIGTKEQAIVAEK